MAQGTVEPEAPRQPALPALVAWLGLGATSPQALALGAGSLRLYPGGAGLPRAGRGRPYAESVPKLRPDHRAFLRFQVCLSRGQPAVTLCQAQPRPAQNHSLELWRGPLGCLRGQAGRQRAECPPGHSLLTPSAALPSQGCHAHWGLSLRHTGGHAP